MVKENKQWFLAYVKNGNFSTMEMDVKPENLLTYDQVLAVLKSFKEKEDK